MVRSPQGQHLRVVLGGGRRSFLPKNISQVLNSQSVESGKRKDGVDLISEWIEDKKHNKEQQSQYITTRDELMSVDINKTDHLLGTILFEQIHAKVYAKYSCNIVLPGLFSSSHLPYVLDLKNETDMPSLVEMTGKALEMLKKNNQNGYFLFVEGKYTVLFVVTLNGH